MHPNVVARSIFIYFKQTNKKNQNWYRNQADNLKQQKSGFLGQIQNLTEMSQAVKMLKIVVDFKRIDILENLHHQFLAESLIRRLIPLFVFTQICKYKATASS